MSDVSYKNTGVISGQLISLETFLETVKNAGNAYLYHEGTLNELPCMTIPVTEGPAATIPYFNWTYAVNNLENDLYNLRNNFLNNHYNKITKRFSFVDAEDVWLFLTEYFWKMNRIATQKFMYYDNPNSNAIIEKTYSGLYNLYYSTVDEYRQKFGSFWISGKIEKGYIITASDVIGLIDGLIKFNLDCELTYNYGNRNRKELRSAQDYVGRCGGFSVAEMYCMMSMIKSRYNPPKNAINGHFVETLVWAFDPTIIDLYYSYQYYVLVANFPQTEIYNTHSGTKYMLYIQKYPPYTGNVLPYEGIKYYDKGTVVEVEAQDTDLSNRFKSWSDGGAKKHKVTIDKDINLIAYFEENKYILSAVSEPNGYCGFYPFENRFDKGETVTLSAIPATCMGQEETKFLRWSDGSTAQYKNITMNSDVTITAYCEKKSPITARIDYDNLSTMSDVSATQIYFASFETNLELYWVSYGTKTDNKIYIVKADETIIPQNDTEGWEGQTVHYIHMNAGDRLIGKRNDGYDSSKLRYGSTITVHDYNIGIGYSSVKYLKAFPVCVYESSQDETITLKWDSNGDDWTKQNHFYKQSKDGTISENYKWREQISIEMKTGDKIMGKNISDNKPLDTSYIKSSIRY